MEMEDHRRHQYSMPDLRQLLNGKPIHFQQFPQDTELFSPGHRNPPPPLQPHLHPFDMMQMVGMQVGSIAYNNNTTTDPMAVTSAASTLSPSCGGFDGDSATAFGGDGGTGRWPRQETLTLLETRSRLDHKFKEANQKGPLWDEVSRIMLEEHGYQRSGKKCREKFENLYKYYKKTKEGKAGRQDGKHYRFFRQLEALYGDTCNNNGVSGQETHLVGTSSQFHGSGANQKLCDSLSLSSSTKFNSCSSDNNELSTAKKRGSRSSKRWKARIKEFIDSQVGIVMERQEAWLVKLTKMLEKNEEERVLREEQWRKEEASRIDREHKFWAKERARIEARDAALMAALHNLKAQQSKADGWQETEVCKLIQQNESVYTLRQQANDGSSHAANDGCFRFFTPDGDNNLWENYGLKLSN